MTPVLLLHSAGLDGRSARYLDLPATVLGPTLPGHGRRGRPRPDLSLADMVDEVAGWLPEPAHVVGLSMGGMVAQQLALAHPDLVRSLVLACTTAGTPTQVLLDRAAATEADPRAETIRTTMRRWFTAAALSGEPAEPVAYARSCLETIDTTALAAVWRALAGHDVTDRLAEITVPTTCVAGRYDVSTPPDVVAALAAGLPDARLVQVDGPHLAMLEEPAAFRATVMEHLARVG
ncbi:alpha/beta fold hydrolase [Jiangella asiatica]|uniref:alpha/beta fold hydrolase n=1 Tax=Jiangella asiatica TaxID=2530372 RepID=UPI0013A5D0A9|nr:alpha/beta fold hydrolase [Jiangella asiatica]